MVFGLVTGLPFSAAFRVVFGFAKTVAAFCPALIGGLARLGGLPAGLVSDNDACIIASRRGGQVRLVDEVAGLYGQLGLRPVVLRPSFPQGKGFIERVIGYLETSFLPLYQRISDDPAEAARPALVGHRGGPLVGLGPAQVRDAGEGARVERAALRSLPAVWPDVDQHLEVRASSDCFVRVGGVDYSVPPRFARRRLAVRASLDQVSVFYVHENISTGHIVDRSAVNGMIPSDIDGFVSSASCVAPIFLVPSSTASMRIRRLAGR